MPRIILKWFISSNWSKTCNWKMMCFPVCYFINAWLMLHWHFQVTTDVHHASHLTTSARQCAYRDKNSTSYKTHFLGAGGRDPRSSHYLWPKMPTSSLEIELTHTECYNNNQPLLHSPTNLLQKYILYVLRQWYAILVRHHPTQISAQVKGQIALQEPCCHGMRQKHAYQVCYIWTYLWMKIFLMCHMVSYILVITATMTNNVCILLPLMFTSLLFRRDFRSSWRLDN